MKAKAEGLMVRWKKSAGCPCVEALILNVTEFADGAVKKVIKIKWGHMGGALIH